jgi:hypothetical protein
MDVVVTGRLRRIAQPFDTENKLAAPDKECRLRGAVSSRSRGCRVWRLSMQECHDDMLGQAKRQWLMQKGQPREWRHREAVPAPRSRLTPPQEPAPLGPVRR